MKTTLGITGCCLTFFLLASHQAAGTGYTASGPTYLNVYVTDGTTTVSPTVSPYNPVETIGSSTHIGTPLTDYGPSSWLQTGPSYPGQVTAMWGPYYYFSANVTAFVD